ncbi:MAG: hypothetical protein HY984_01425 [Candidatus Magasanikbacteria bacterium]|nr:hypothetical protein [Candidatus Magasanikbacteria bacterium]
MRTPPFLTFTLCALAVLSSTILLTRPVSAQLDKALGNLETTAEKQAGYKERKIENVVGQVINAALTLVGIIFLIFMVYAGYLWMTARGEQEPIDKAKKILYGTIIGLIITLSAYAITVFVTKRFEGGGGGGCPTTADRAVCDRVPGCALRTIEVGPGQTRIECGPQ